MSAMRRRALLFAALVVLTACGDDSPNDAPTGGTTNFANDCRVRFAMTAGELSGEFQAIFDHSRAPGHFFGVNVGVECERLDSRAAVYGANQCTGRDGACRDRDHRELYVVAQTTQAISAPLDLLDCRFVGSRVPAVEDFVHVATFATDADGAIVDPPPTVEVTSVECRGPETTTTTLPALDPCRDVSCADGEACIDGDCVGTNRFAVELRTDTEAAYAALQVDVSYDCADGRFDGLGGSVACRAAPEINAYAAFNNTGCLLDGEQPRVTAGVISLLGWPGPGPFMSCDYVSADGAPPSPDLFRIEVVDAVSMDDKPIENVRVSVGAIRAIAP